MSTTDADDSTELNTIPYNYSPELNEYELTGDAPAALVDLFAALRTHQIVTVMGDVCCRSCAHSAARNHARELEGEGRDVAGHAVFSEQDLNENWDHDYEEGFVTYDTEFIYVGFSGRDLPDAAVAGLILEAAETAGLDAEWSGDTSRCVKVHL